MGALIADKYYITKREDGNIWITFQTIVPTIDLNGELSTEVKETSVLMSTQSAKAFASMILEYVP